MAKEIREASNWDFRVKEGSPEVVRLAEKTKEVGELTYKVSLDVSEALTALKAIQREARAAAGALRELEAEIERRQTIEVEMDGRKIGEIVTPSARDLGAVNIAYTIVVDKNGNKTLLPSQINGEIITSSARDLENVVTWIETGNDDVVINYTDKDGIPKRGYGVKWIFHKIWL